MVLTQAQRTALEAAMLAHLTAEGERCALTLAAFTGEAQLDFRNAVQTSVGGVWLKRAWGQMQFSLDYAVSVYLAAQGGRFSRTVEAFETEAQFRDDDGILGAGSSVATLEEAWVPIANDRRRSSLAISEGDLAAVQKNVWMGVNVAGDNNGKSALRCATTYNQLQIVKYFVDLGFDMDAIGGDGMNPLLIACAAAYRLFDIAEHLLEKGCDSNRADARGMTALHNTAFDGDHKTVQLLARYGAQLDARMPDGMTPLLVACDRGYASVVECLLYNGCDRVCVSNTGWAGLHYAASRGHLDVAEVLFRYGAQLDALTPDGMTPLLVACEEGHANVAEYLLYNGCDRVCLGTAGWTALHYAAANNYLAVAEVLFRYGSQLDARNNDGLTPADLATANGHQHIADAIRAEEIRRRDHGFKRDRSTIEGTEEHEAAKRPRVAQRKADAVDGSDDDDDDDDDDDEG